ncbi:MAG TPA: aconitase X catalytic domain-containing protein [Nitrososphaerales archaeon]|nr:aconitase X catalytic domain-containing protein [Nitrososphaerales archaeon]
MRLTKEEEGMLAGEGGFAAQKSMQILVALGEIYGAERMVEVSSVQVSGVSYKNLGDAGIEFLNELARDGRARVKTTLNPAGMSLTDWESQGIKSDFAEKQFKVIDAYRRLGVEVSCTCTPYLAGNEPRFSQHIAWSESSAVVYANSVLGARTNREGGPSALAASLTGRTPLYGYHLDENRRPTLKVEVKVQPMSPEDFSAMGYFIGRAVKDGVPYFAGIRSAGLEELKTLSAALASSGGVAMFHMEGITPESRAGPGGAEALRFTSQDLSETTAMLNDVGSPDFVSVGCPHCSLAEVKTIVGLLRGRKATKEFWVCCSREVKRQSDEAGYSRQIERSGAKFATDTCMVVAPVEELGFRVVATNSAKACHYLRNGGLKVRFMTLEECVMEATGKA